MALTRVVFVESTGGLTDRFKSMISVFDYCCTKGIDFKIYSKKPYDFEMFFQPNQYDWSIIDAEYNVLIQYGLHVWLESSNKVGVNIWHEQMAVLDHFINSNLFDCIVVHQSAPNGLSARSFHQLFKPTDWFLNIVNQHKVKIHPYSAFSFRFVNLLGDSDEDVDGFYTLSEYDQNKLMSQCYQIMLDNVLDKSERILVTTDSFKFLQFLDNKHNNQLYYIKGEEIHHHIGFNNHVNMVGITKSYTEFMLLSTAQSVCQIQVGPMYESKFPKWAACVGNVSYSIINSTVNV